MEQLSDEVLRALVTGFPSLPGEKQVELCVLLRQAVEAFGPSLKEKIVRLVLEAVGASDTLHCTDFVILLAGICTPEEATDIVMSGR